MLPSSFYPRASSLPSPLPATLIGLMPTKHKGLEPQGQVSPPRPTDDASTLTPVRVKAAVTPPPPVPSPPALPSRTLTLAYRSLLSLHLSSLGPGYCTEEELTGRLELYTLLEEHLTAARDQGYGEGYQRGYDRGTRIATRARVPIVARPAKPIPARRVARAIERGIARGEVLPFVLPAHLDPEDPLLTVGSTPDATDTPEPYTEDSSE